MHITSMALALEERLELVGRNCSDLVKTLFFPLDISVLFFFDVLKLSAVLA